MAKNELYTREGWINAQLWFNDPAPFVVCIGGRGTGKTFGALDILTSPDNGYGKFVYMRRSQSQIDACKLSELNPFKSINDARGRSVIMTAMGKYVAGIYNGQLDKDSVLRPAGEPVGIGIALSVFSNIRGVDGLGYDFLLYDEFIKETHEKPIKAEGSAFLNAYETLNRNRELQGRVPLKALLLSNSNDLSSPILDAMGLVKVVDHMQRKGQSRATAAGGAISVYLYQDSPISARKAATALYRVANNNGDFANMALHNKFSAANYEYVANKPLKEYRPLVSIGNVTVYEHVNNGTYYVVAGVKAEDRYSMLPIDIKGFRRNYWYLYEAMLQKSLFYASAPIKIEFEGVWK